MTSLPSGRVTFLMTDVQGSTRMWEEHAETASRVIERHTTLIEEAVDGHHGVLIKSKGEGDSTFSVFEDAPRRYRRGDRPPAEAAA